MNISQIDPLLKEAVKGKISPPSDYVEKFGNKEAMTEFLKDIRQQYSDALGADQANRLDANSDFDFVIGNQWDKEVMEKRQTAGLPCLVFNRILPFVLTVLGERSLSMTSIKVLPDKDGTVQIAKIREGLIRHIEKMSNAQIAYDKAYHNQVVGGDGAFAINLSYVSDDVFDQKITIDPIENPFSVVWDHHSVDPTGKDARFVFTMEVMTKNEFNRIYPDADAGDFMSTGVPNEEPSNFSWETIDMVRVARYYRVRYSEVLLAMMGDGSVRDITDVEEEELLEIINNIALDSDENPYIRQVRKPYVEMWVTNGRALLEPVVIFNCPRVPIIRVMGHDICFGTKRVRWGLVRYLKDPQRLHNYWRSILAERLAAAPRAKWLASVESVGQFEKDYETAATSHKALLRWNADSGTPPIQILPIPLETALVQEASMAAQDLRDISNMHEASMGMQSNEVSGKAVLARQRQSSVSLYVYTKNMNEAVKEAGRVINELIPYVYDAPRIIKIIGDDDNEQDIEINLDGALSIGTGKYSVNCSVAPTFATKRAESAEYMSTVVNAMPEVMSSIAPDIIRIQDWPNADKIADKLEQIRDPMSRDTSKMSEEEKMAYMQQKQQQEQMQQEQAMLQMESLQVDLAYKRAQTEESLARAEQAKAIALKAMIDAGISEDEANSKIQTATVDNVLKVMQSQKGENPNV